MRFVKAKAIASAEFCIGTAPTGLRIGFGMLSRGCAALPLGYFRPHPAGGDAVIDQFMKRSSDDS